MGLFERRSDNAEAPQEAPEVRQEAPSPTPEPEAPVTPKAKVYAFTNQQLKNAFPQPVSREAATMATIEKSDEGGSP